MKYLDETDSMLSKMFTLMCKVPNLTQVLTELWVLFSFLFRLFSLYNNMLKLFLNMQILNTDFDA